MAVKILLDAGHYANYNQGADRQYYEGNFAWELMGYLMDDLKAYGFTVASTKATINDYPIAYYTNGKSYDNVYARGLKASGYDLMISLHSDSCDSSSVRRVNILTQSASGFEKGKKVGADLGAKIGAAVKSVMGITEATQIVTKLTSAGNEWYGLLRGARKAGTPAILIEHSFHSNVLTCQWQLKSENLKKLAQAEADVIAAYYGVSSATATATTTTTVQETPAATTTTTTEEDDIVSKIPTVKYGSTGSIVKVLQGSLTALGYAPGTADGIAGSRTVAAIKAFQTANKLTADGICGIKTWSKVLQI